MHRNNSVAVCNTQFNFELTEAGKRVSHRVYVVYAGMEPMTFKALFPYWNDTPDVMRIQKQVGNV